MKRSTIRAAILLLAALMFPAAAYPQTPIKIGFIATLSGPAGLLGRDQYDGFMLFVDGHGGKLGGVPVQVLKQDSQRKLELAVESVQRLIDGEHVSIITGLTFNDIMMAVFKQIVEKHVVLIGTNTGPAPIAGPRCSPYAFITSFQINTMAVAMARYANEKGYKSLYLMAPNYQSGRDFLSGFKEVYKGRIAGEVYTPLGQPDFSGEITQLAAAKPDAVFVFYPGAFGVNFIRQYRQAGLMQTIPLLSAGAADGTTFGALKDDALGVLNVAPWGPDLDNPANRKFVAEFEGRYHRIPTMFAASSYDAAQILDAAIAKVKGDLSNKPAFLAAIKTAAFPSVRGAFRFGNNNFPIQDYYIQKVEKDAKGRVSLATIDTPLKDVVDKYAAQCPMK